MIEWSLDALRAAGIEQIVVALPEGADGARGLRRRARRRDALGVRPRRARAAAPRRRRRRARRGAPAGRARPVHAACWPRSRTPTARSRRRRMTDTVKEAVDGVVTATLDRSRLWAVQTPQAFRRAALEAALAVDEAILARATDDAWLVERAGGTRARGRVLARELQGHDPARPARGRHDPARTMLTDYHVHLRPDDPGTRRRAVLHRRQRRALPRDRRRARRGRARRLRAHPPLHRRARRLAAPVLARERRRRPRRLRRRSCARRPTSGSGSRPTTSPAARTGWRTCSTRTSGTT